MSAASAQVHSRRLYSRHHARAGQQSEIGDGPGRYCRHEGKIAQIHGHSGERAVHAMFDLVGTTWLDEPALRAVDPKLRSFLNVNTPEDLRTAQAEGEGDKGGGPQS